MSDTMTPTPLPTVELDRAELHRLLTPVLPFAGTDPMLPVLCTVKLDVHGEHLYATATNRFRAAMHRVPVAGHLRGTGPEQSIERGKLVKRAQGFTALVTTADLRAILGVWPAGRRGAWTPTLELTAVPNDHGPTVVDRKLQGSTPVQVPSDRPRHHGLTVRDAGTRDRKVGPRITYDTAHIDGEYPPVASLFRQAIDDSGKPSEHGVTGMSDEHYGVALAAAQSTVHRGGAVVMRNVSDKMTAVYGSPDFVAIVMQRRLLEDVHGRQRVTELAADRDALEAWKAYLDGAPTPAAVSA